MSDDDKYCFSLSELAEKWSKTENDILHLAAQNKLWLSVNLNDYKPDNIGEIKIDLCLSPFQQPYFDGKEIKAWLHPLPLNGWWQLLIPKEIAGFLPDREESYFTHFRNPKNNTCKSVKLSGECVSYKITRGNIFIMAAEVERFEKEHHFVVDSNVVRFEAEQQVNQVVGSLHEGLDDIMKKFRLLFDESESRSRGWLNTWMEAANVKYLKPVLNKKKRIALNDSQILKIYKVYTSRKPDLQKKITR